MIQCKDRSDLLFLLDALMPGRALQLKHRKQTYTIANALQVTPFKHTCTVQRHKNAHTYRELKSSMGALISSEQTPQVMGMFSGCYLVLCRNEIASHLYHHPQTLEGP